MTPYETALTEICVWREARGEPFEGKVAVAWVIRNRVEHPQWWGRGYDGVILCPAQFSSFNKSDPEATMLPLESDASFTDCVRAVSGVLSNAIADPTSGANSYYAITIPEPPQYKGMTPTYEVGKHRFYKLG